MLTGRLKATGTQTTSVAWKGASSSGSFLASCRTQSWLRFVLFGSQSVHAKQNEVNHGVVQQCSGNEIREASCKLIKMLILWQSLLRTTALLPAVPVAKSSKRDDFLWAGKRCPPPPPPSPHHKKSSVTVRGLRLKAPETERENIHSGHCPS